MQKVEHIPHWLTQVLATVATFLAGGGLLKLIQLYLNRNKPAVEIHKTAAEATEITIRSHSTAGDAVIRMIDRLEETQGQIDLIRDERDALRMRVDTQAIELRLRDDQIKRIKALMDFKGIKLSDFEDC